MHRKLIALVVAATVTVALAAPALGADGDPGTGSVTAAVGGGSPVGTRSVTSVTPTVLLPVPGSSNMTGAVTVVITELARTGTASWSVTAILDEVGGAGSGNGLTDNGSPATYIPRSAVSINAATPGIIAGCSVDIPACTTALGSSGNLSSARTLYSINGEDTGLTYTGTYTSAHTLTLGVPNLQKTGVYTGTLRVALVQ